MLVRTYLGCIILILSTGCGNMSQLHMKENERTSAQDHLAAVERALQRDLPDVSMLHGAIMRTPQFDALNKLIEQTKKSGDSSVLIEFVKDDPELKKEAICQLCKAAYASPDFGNDEDYRGQQSTLQMVIGLVKQAPQAGAGVLKQLFEHFPTHHHGDRESFDDFQGLVVSLVKGAPTEKVLAALENVFEKSKAPYAAQQGMLALVKEDNQFRPRVEKFLQEALEIALKEGNASDIFRISTALSALRESES